MLFSKPAAPPDPLAALFNPRSVALIGATDKPGKVGCALLRNLAFGSRVGTSRDTGFKGKVYPVNPRGGEMCGLKVFPSVLEITDEVDYAVIALAPAAIPEVVEKCGVKGVKAISIISGGFGEMGEAGKKLEDDCVARAKRYGARILGPNTLGVIRTPNQMNASFALEMPPRGRIALVSQSGALITGLIQYAHEEKIGFSTLASIGDKADITDTELLRWLAADPETDVIGLYLEALRDGRGFLKAVREIVKTKPIVVYKSGRSEGGAKAAASHTGSLAGSDAAYDAVFRQAGLFRAETVFDMVDALVALARQPAAKGDRIAVLTNAGGPGVIAADTISLSGMSLASLEKPTMDLLSTVLPPIWSHNNPVDIIGDADPQRYDDSLKVLLSAPEVDGVVVILTPQAMTDPLDVAKRIVAQGKARTKPICATFVGMVAQEGENFLDSNGIPERAWPERAVRSMYSLVHRGRVLARLAKGDDIESMPTASPYVMGLLADLKKKGVKNVPLADARKLAGAVGIPMNQAWLARTVDEAKVAAQKIGYPVVMKVVSEQVVHKTEVGGVRVGLQSEAEVVRAFQEINESVRAKIPSAVIQGFTVEEMIRGTELILGGTTDPLFGKMVMFGLGGIFVEVLKDVSFRVCPLGMSDALSMIDDLRARKILEGARGLPPVDKHQLARLILTVNHVLTTYPMVREIDINPLVASANGLFAIDARVILE
ncbi:MAG: acetate--CoA ligase family protein [Planctomycetota bacterium]